MRPAFTLGCGCALIFLAAGHGPVPAADPSDPGPIITKLEPAEVVRGSTVTLTLQPSIDPAKGEKAYLWLKHQDAIPKGDPTANRKDADDPFGPYLVTIGQKKDTATCQLPASLPLGPYLAGISRSDLKPSA